MASGRSTGRRQTNNDLLRELDYQLSLNDKLKKNFEEKEKELKAVTVDTEKARVINKETAQSHNKAQQKIQDEINTLRDKNMECAGVLNALKSEGRKDEEKTREEVKELERTLEGLTDQLAASRKEKDDLKSTTEELYPKFMSLFNQKLDMERQKTEIKNNIKKNEEKLLKTEDENEILSRKSLESTNELQKESEMSAALDEEIEKLQQIRTQFESKMTVFSRTVEEIAEKISEEVTDKEREAEIKRMEFAEWRREVHLKMSEKAKELTELHKVGQELELFQLKKVAQELEIPPPKKQSLFRRLMSLFRRRRH